MIGFCLMKILFRKDMKVKEGYKLIMSVVIMIHFNSQKFSGFMISFSHYDKSKPISIFYITIRTIHQINI